MKGFAISDLPFAIGDWSGRVKWRELNEQHGKVQAYFAFHQLPFNTITVVMKTALEPVASISAVRQQAIAALCPHDARHQSGSHGVLAQALGHLGDHPQPLDRTGA